MAKGKQKKDIVEEVIDDVVEEVKEAVEEIAEVVKKALESYVYRGRIILPGDPLPTDEGFRPTGKDAE